MSRFPELLAAGLIAVALAAPALAAGDPAEGEKLFKRCAACHAVGEGAAHKVGPHLNDVIGRTAGTAEGFAFSKAMIALGEEGTVWDAESLDAFLAAPRQMVKGTKMAFAGLAKEEQRADVIAFLKAHSGDAEAAAAEAEAPAEPAVTQQAAAPAPETVPGGTPSDGPYHLGRLATKEEIAAWDIDVRPDGEGLPEGAGTVADGEVVFTERCASCHGDFGEGRDRWPVLAGGFDTLTDQRPVKTIGSYWPYLSTVYDYVRRAMPFGDARSLSDDEVYALTAYLLYLNDIVTDEAFELSKENFSEIELPNVANFVPDDREQEAHYQAGSEPCMSDCKPGPVEITKRAQVLDVTPEGDGDNDGAGAVD